MKQVWTVLPNVVFAHEEDGALLYHPETGEVKILNETGAFIYQLLDGTHTEEDIVDELMKTFDQANQASVHADVREFIEELRKANYLGRLD